ncbi:MAG: isochorismate synthase [Vibrio sp.]
MTQLNQAFLQCKEQILSDAHQTRITQKFTPEDDFSLIDWLAAQAIYPQFYWQSRDAHEEVVALGEALGFHDPMAVYPHLASGQRVWGGKSFDVENSQAEIAEGAYFFLPQVEITRVEDTWQLHINLQGSRDALWQTLSQLVLEYEPLTGLKKQTAQITHTPEFSKWQQVLNQALDAMEKQQFEKVVLARQTQVLLQEPILAAQLLKVSREKNLRSYHFMLSFGPNFSFLGSTPECLYRRMHNQVETEALAGTIGRSDDLAEDAKLSHWLLHDEKNRRENQFVVDDIMQRLTPKTQHLQVQVEAELVRLRKVQHLRRKVKGDLALGVKGAELLDVLQPTAAIAGLPRQQSLDFIRQYEPFNRRWYSGSLGYISHESAEFCVTIRSAIVEGHQVSLYAGAGIVPGSKAQFEWQELDRKTSTLMSLFVESDADELTTEHSKSTEQE